MNDPLRLQVIDRIVRVLNDIEEGTDYFFTPRQVGKGFIAEPIGYPVYMVMSEEGNRPVMHSDNQFVEPFFIAVSGRVREQGDVVTPVERALRDVRRAIDRDRRSGAGSGSLLELLVNLELDASTITYDADSVGPFAEFTQRYLVETYGEFGEL